MWCTGVFFNGYVGVAEPVHAVSYDEGAIQDPAEKEDAKAPSTMALRETLNLVLKLIYLLLWPLLIVAGIALDNTLVYASVFHLDAPLWKFWNMMKNFANFALWFMVLFAIIKNLFMPKDEKWPIDIIKKTLIAGILIQASRFLMAAMVDISTIATYAVGWLPLSVLKNTDIGKQKILTVNSEIDLDKFSSLSEKWEDFRIWYSTVYPKWANGKQIDISPCNVKNSFIIGRELGDPQFNNFENFKDDKSGYAWYEVCVLFGNQLVMWNEVAFMKLLENYTCDNNIACLQDYGEGKWSVEVYKSHITALTNITWWRNTDLVKKNLVNLKLWYKQDAFVKWNNFFGASTSTTISDLINKSKWFVGPLVTMYSSLLNFAQLTDTSVTSISETSGIFLIKTWIAIALFFPLIALAIVLIARVGLLRLYIAWSPFLVIKKVFSDFIPKEALWGLDKHLDLNNVFKLIFAPVITVAALSISLIFMTALINGFKTDDNQHISAEMAESFHMQPADAKDPDNEAFMIGSSQVEFKNFDRWWSLDRLSRLIVNFFAIGLLRTILFAAIKANALGDFIQKQVQDFGQNVFSTMPIISLPWWWNVGVGSAWNVLSNRPEQWIGERVTSQNNKIEDLFKEPDIPTAFTTDTASKYIISGATKEDIEKWMTELKVKKEDMKAFIGSSASISAMYEAIEKIKDKAEKDKLITATEEAGAPEGWYDTYTTGKLKADLDTIISGKKDLTAKDQVETFINNTPANKDKMDAYFAAGNTIYTTPPSIDKKTYTITKSGDKYVATETTTPTSQETALKGIIGTPTNKAALETIFKEPTEANKTIIENYFATITTTGPKTYEITAADNKKYTITQTPTAGTTPQAYTYPITTT